MDCMARIIHNEMNNKDKTKKTWFWDSFTAAHDQQSVEMAFFNNRYAADDWEQMDMICVAVNIKDSHHFLLVIHFSDSKIYVLDSSEGVRRDVSMKLEFLHNTLCQSCFQDKYKQKDRDIRGWNVIHTNDWNKLPTQTNTNDCGAYVCFFMAHIRDIIPEPREQITVVESYLRVWIANTIVRSQYNTLKDRVLEEFNRVNFDDEGILKHIEKTYAEILKG